MSRFWPVKNIMSTTPLRAKGMENMMMKGLENDSNWEAMTM